MAGSRASLVQRLFLVSVALFISGIAFIIAGARAARLNPPAHADLPAAPAVATIKQIMNAIVLPNANVIYNAVGTTIDGTNGRRDGPEERQGMGRRRRQRRGDRRVRQHAAGRRQVDRQA
jgi:hypothetical protein